MNADPGRATDAPPAPYLSWRPPDALSPYLRSVVVYDLMLPGPGTHRGLPSTGLTLVLPLGEPLDVGWHARPATRAARWSCVSGLHLGPAAIYHDGRQTGIQLALTAAGSRRLLGVPAAELAGALTHLDDVAPALADLPARLAEATTWRERLAMLGSRLLAQLAGTSPAVPRPEVSWALRLLSGPSPVSAVATTVGRSRRHLSGLFRAEYGVTPKQYQRIARFEASHRALARQARAGRPALAQVAAACGYADQAHLTREWTALAGYSPVRWLRAEFPFRHEFPSVQDAADDPPLA